MPGAPPAALGAWIEDASEGCGAKVDEVMSTILLTGMRAACGEGYDGTAVDGLDVVDAVDAVTIADTR